MISVLVIDDSALIRSLLSEIINQHPLLSLAGTARDAFVAKEMVNKLHPDVIILDIEMPKVSGLVFLDRLMKARPTPVLMFSSLTEEGAQATIDALSLGAVDFIAKPKLDIANKINEFRDELTDKVLLASQANIARRPHIPLAPKQLVVATEKLLVAVGASTGGTEAIREVLVELPENFPAVLVAQHMPAGFTASFAQRLNKLCKMRVVEASHDMLIHAGTIYIAPGEHHLTVSSKNDCYYCCLTTSAKVNGHRPSVDTLFNSVAQVYGKKSAGVILTGMGKDGAQGLKAMHDTGAETIAQSEASCVVFGMPKEAIKLNAAGKVQDLQGISVLLFNWAAG